MVATRPITIEEFETMLLEGQWELIDGEAVVPAFLQALSLRFTAEPALVATRARRVRDTLALDTPFQSIHTAVAAAAAGLIERTTAGAAGAALLCLVALQDTLSTYALFIEVKATPAGATASVIVHAAMRAAGAELVRLVRARLPDGVGRCRGRLLHGDARRRETARGIAAAANGRNRGSRGASDSCWPLWRSWGAIACRRRPFTSGSTPGAVPLVAQRRSRRTLRRQTAR